MSTDAKVVIAVDESGMGSLAGPIFVCATAFLQDATPPTVTFRGLRKDKVLVAGDSKSFKDPLQREMLDTVIRDNCYAMALIERSNHEIDAKLLYGCFAEALALAIARCIEAVVARNVYTDPNDFVVLVDGETTLPRDLPCKAHAIPDGDKTCWQIGAASIVAKVACDAAMETIHKQYPRYEFSQSKGYGTKRHKELLKQYGPCAAHRQTFRPVQDARGPIAGCEF